MSPFTPIGDKARWRTLYDVLRKHDIGDLVTYQVMAEALGLDPTDGRHTIQVAMRRAAQEFEVADRRAVEAVPNRGYRIVQPSEQLDLARIQQRKSHRALARGRQHAVYVDLSKVDPQTRQAFEIVAQAFALQQDFNRRLDVRQRRLEESLAVVTEKAERSEDEVSTLRERMERLERRLGTA